MKVRTLQKCSRISSNFPRVVGLLNKRERVSFLSSPRIFCHSTKGRVKMTFWCMLAGKRCARYSKGSFRYCWRKSSKSNGEEVSCIDWLRCLAIRRVCKAPCFLTLALFLLLALSIVAGFEPTELGMVNG